MVRKLQLCAHDTIEVGATIRIDLSDPELRLAVVRLSETDVRVVDDKCSHADFSLSAGPLDTEELTLECPKHGALFSLDSGEALCLPATKPIDVYPVEIVDGQIVVELASV